jgi:acyl carrier protein
MMSREAITADLMDALRYIRGEDATAPTLDMDFIKDLKMLSDDISEVILMTQDTTGIKPPIREWNKVGTLREAVDLLLRYAPPD